MKCPYCDYQDSRVVDSRGVDAGIRRRRECLHCGSRFTTYERVQAGSFLVVKKDGRREEFSRDKLATGIRKACIKRPISSETIEGLADQIEQELHQLGRLEVSSSAIGEMAMRRLMELDRIAYIRFASVYREFGDIESFRQEVDALTAGTELEPHAAQLPLIPRNESASLTRRRGGKRARRGS